MSNYRIGREFETVVANQFKILELRGLLEIVGRNVKVLDKDGNEREIDILLRFLGPFYQVEVCVECKIISDGDVSQLTQIAA